MIVACVRAALLTFSIALMLTLVGGGRPFQFDFRGDLYSAGHAIVARVDPYQPQLLEAEVAAIRAGGSPPVVASPRYPPPALLAAVPLSLLPIEVASVLFMLLSIGAVILALRLLGVRDWRCVAAACISDPVVSGTWLGNLSPLLLLAVAVLWRCRARLRTPALAVAVAVAGKLFLWPLSTWLLVTRRFRAFVLSVLITTVTIFSAWAVIGFAGLAEYPHLLANVAYIGGHRGFSLVSALLSLGLPMWVARGVALAVAMLMVAAAAVLVRRQNDARRAFGLVVMACLTATPVVWDHYLVLLFVPIALLRPRYSTVWLVPTLAGLVRAPVTDPSIWHSVPDLAIEAAVIGWLCLPLVGGATHRLAWRPARFPRLIAIGASPDG